MIPKYPDMDRIDNISAELAQRFAVLYDKIATLTAERDEARREVCFVISEYDLENGISISPEDVAIEYEWDCFKDMQNE
jgi:hypothetical protein